jgi:hypothetical protein
MLSIYQTEKQEELLQETVLQEKLKDISAHVKLSGDMEMYFPFGNNGSNVTAS